MQFHIIKRKNGSLRELGNEVLELDQIYTIEDFLTQVTVYEYRKQLMQPEHIIYDSKDIEDMGKMGKITFGQSYSENNYDITKVINVMKQDFEDGLFRVYINGKEYTQWEDKIELVQDNEVVFIRLVMMAGRLW